MNRSFGEGAPGVFRLVTPGRVRSALLALAVGQVACVSQPRPPAGDRVEVLVVAPHPDDEVLMAAGAIEAAIHRGARVAVAIVTNGDKGCERDGYRREAESIAALAQLGVPERDVYFLGYPDGHLAELSNTPLTGVLRRDAGGGCVAFEVPWAVRGHGGVELHRTLHDAPAPLTAQALGGDLAELLARLKPSDVYLPHPLDLHADHAAVYRFVRSAIETAGGPPPRLHRSLVHAAGCWPAADCDRPYDPLAAVAPLPEPLSAYLPDEAIDVDPRRKLSLIGLYQSQLRKPLELDWLASFARPREAFFSERLGAPSAAGAVSLPLNTCGRVRLPVDGGSCLFSWAAPTLELSFDSGAGATPVRQWQLPVAPPGTWRLQLHRWPASTAVTELSIFDPGGFAAEAVISASLRPSGPATADCTGPGSPAPPKASR